VNPHLDDWLSSQRMGNVKRKRSWMKFFRQCYERSIPSFGNQPKMDVFDEHSHYSFHYGVPTNDLRTIASWTLTECQGNERRIAKLIPLLWKRKGREDCLLAGFFLANLPPSAIQENVWMVFIHLLQKTEPVEIILEISAELKRAGHEIPNDDWFVAMAEQSTLWHQYAVLILSQSNTLSEQCRLLVVSAPKGGELFERIRESILVPKN
jgi:hypothetical protein